ncbi:hypothetical protein A3Q56_07899 [Intoshia linei]|uniref:Uncharacterized protein n=1 Tax=Intoshia linei TaxID=1819745 RepID=A0A177AQZ0_9BILA|nr:hypothetical protein A3Q56_07899 [Intoshia linei]
MFKKKTSSRRLAVSPVTEDLSNRIRQISMWSAVNNKIITRTDNLIRSASSNEQYSRNYKRRQYQLQNCGYNTPNYLPYRILGEPLNLKINVANRKNIKNNLIPNVFFHHVQIDHRVRSSISKFRESIVKKKSKV